MADAKEHKGSDDAGDDLGEPNVKIILLGDSAVGKSKLVERFMMNEFQPRQLSTFALTMFRKEVKLDNGSVIKVDFWDTAGQERFSSMHASYYYGATACILVFDVTRKVTYQNLANWYKELRDYCENIPCFLVANKIDVDLAVTSKKFKFAETHNLEFNFVSAADGTNVVKVFTDAVQAAVRFKEEGGDFMSDVLDLLGESSTSLYCCMKRECSFVFTHVCDAWVADAFSFRNGSTSPAVQVAFDVAVQLHGCSNIPHPRTRVYCKWKLQSVGGRVFGLTDSCEVTSANQVVWDHTFDLRECVMKMVPQSKIVKPCVLRLSVRQENRGVTQAYKRLGVVNIDLAEFAGCGDTPRTYLLEESRLNSTLSVTIRADQVKGDVMFRR
ncbi:TPA: hypothetical protein N0F65_008182 [Lagenidium giganteum]|uniref:C2 NT-type domain-containing protein n=1 Tax=Lagenidium giganteum TaxID=4803 RepID=A0AAV2YLV4_9STRA|nr:TPA: hypothetical protein N0F65_008182 [Lagenidium giganteum]